MMSMPLPDFCQSTSALFSAYTPILLDRDLYRFAAAGSAVRYLHIGCVGVAGPALIADLLSLSTLYAERLLHAVLTGEQGIVRIA